MTSSRHPLCRDCANYEHRAQKLPSPVCHRVFDLVTGEDLSVGCRDARAPEGWCRRDGLLFERRRTGTPSDA